MRRGDLHHVAGWIHSSSLGDVLHVVGRFLSSLTRCERSGQNSRIIGVILIMWAENYVELLVQVITVPLGSACVTASWTFV
jgi:hypothetical protein